MTNPVFKVGDKIYLAGEDEYCLVTNYKFYRDRHIYMVGDKPYWLYEDVLSFTLWPKADHKRPVQEGWWCFKHTTGGFSKYKVGWLKEDKLYIAKGEPEYWSLGSEELVCFLGSEDEPKSQLDKT